MTVYRLPESMRSKLAEPMGRLFTSVGVKGPEFAQMLKESKLVITVGDRTTEALGELGRVPDIQVVDGKEERREREPPVLKYDSIIRATNPPATLTTEAIEAVRAAMKAKKPVRVLVEGEEDLVAIPTIALAPVSSLVLYGQPGKGMVAVRVDAASKRRNRKVMKEIGLPRIG